MSYQVNKNSNGKIAVPNIEVPKNNEIKLIQEKPNIYDMQSGLDFLESNFAKYIENRKKIRNTSFKTILGKMLEADSWEEFKNTGAVLSFKVETIIEDKIIFPIESFFDGIEEKIDEFKNKKDENIKVETPTTTVPPTTEPVIDLGKLEPQTQETTAEITEPDYTGAAAKASGGEIYPSKTYELTEEEIETITRLCYAEQENQGAKGIAAEASLIANLYEYKKADGGLVHYVTTGGWFGERSVEFADNNMTEQERNSYKAHEDEYRAIVYDVLVNGNRTIPSNVVEHDYKGDIISATNNGKHIDIWDNSQYISGVTQIKNNSGATYTFYCFFDEDDPNADPFGYIE